MNLIKPGINIDVVGKRKYAAIASASLVILSLILFFVKGPNWGIDFTGGTEIHLKFADPVEIKEVRDAIVRLDLSGDAVQRIGEPDAHEYLVRIQDPTFGTGGMEDSVKGALEGRFGAGWIEESRFDAQVGARITIRYGGEPVNLRDIEVAMKGVEGAKVQSALDDNTFYVNMPGLDSRIQAAISATLPDRSFKVLQTESVGSKVGGELREQGLVAILATLGLVLVYVAFRFDLAFAPGAVIALFHDVTLTVGVFVLLGREFNLPIIGALLTIIGYSLNDTIVIYDRIRENMKKYRRRDLMELINTSVNETLGRTLATSFTTMLAMTAFLVLGGQVIETFALAIMLGIVFGTYSTIYVASPMILVMQDLRPTLDKIFAPMGTKKVDMAANANSGSAAEQRRLHRQGIRSPGSDEDSGGTGPS